MANGLLTMSPEIEAYKQDYVGWIPKDVIDAQNYYKIMQYMKSLPPEMRPSTDMDIMNFMNQYSDTMRQNKGLLGGF